MAEQQTTPNETPNKLFLWNSVMCGCYTGGVAFAIAKTKDHAKAILMAELKDLLSLEVHLPQLGTWLNEVDYSDPERTKKVDTLLAKFKKFSPGSSDAKKTFDALSEEEKHLFRVIHGVVQEEPDHSPAEKERKRKCILAQFAKELDSVEPIEQELVPFCYFRGGGD